MLIDDLEKTNIPTYISLDDVFVVIIIETCKFMQLIKVFIQYSSKINSWWILNMNTILINTKYIPNMTIN